MTMDIVDMDIANGMGNTATSGSSKENDDVKMVVSDDIDDTADSSKVAKEEQNRDSNAGEATGGDDSVVGDDDENMDEDVNGNDNNHSSSESKGGSEESNKSDHEDGDDDDDEDSDNSSSSSDDDDGSASDEEDGSSSSSDDDDGDDKKRNPDGLSDYELMRLERIKRNQERLQQLGLLDPNLKKKSKANGGSNRKPKPQRRSAAVPIEPRRSQPRRSAKSNLSFREQQIDSFGEITRGSRGRGGRNNKGTDGQFDSRKWRETLTLRQRRNAAKLEKQMYSRRYQCYECDGCQLTKDCGTCIFCVDRISEQPKYGNRKCIFRMCMRRLIEVVHDDLSDEDENEAETSGQSKKPPTSASTHDMDNPHQQHKQEIQNKPDHMMVNRPIRKPKGPPKKKVMMIGACIKPTRIKKHLKVPAKLVLPTVAVEVAANAAAAANASSLPDNKDTDASSSQQQQPENGDDAEEDAKFSYFPDSRSQQQQLYQPRHIIDRVSRNILHDLIQPVDDGLVEIGWTVQRRSRKKHYFAPGEEWDTRRHPRLDTIKKLIDFLKSDNEWKNHPVVKTIVTTFDEAVKENAVEEEDPPPPPPPPIETTTVAEAPIPMDIEKTEEEKEQNHIPSSSSVTEEHDNMEEKDHAPDTNTEGDGADLLSDSVVQEEKKKMEVSPSQKPLTTAQENNTESVEKDTMEDEVKAEEKKENGNSFNTVGKAPVSGPFTEEDLKPAATNPQENNVEPKPKDEDAGTEEKERVSHDPSTEKVVSLPPSATNYKEIDNDIVMTGTEDARVDDKSASAYDLPPTHVDAVSIEANKTICQNNPEMEIDPSSMNMVGISHSKTKKGMGKPKRPMSAYNIFFKDQRAKILAEIPGGQEVLEDPGDETGRRKTHGKISFFDLAKNIGERWKDVSPEELEVYKARAGEEMSKYRKAMAVWEQEQLQRAKAVGDEEQKNQDGVHKALGQSHGFGHLEQKHTNEKNVDGGAPSATNIEADHAMYPSVAKLMNVSAYEAIEFDTTNDLCAVCSKGSFLIYCDACKKGYHSNCHVRPIREIPIGPWTCHSCKHFKPKRTPKTPKPPKEKREKLLKNLKLFQGEHEDDCYICFNGGELVCCDFCPKSFHCACHVPPLPYVPTGIWKCCECSAVERTKKSKCGECEACKREDCGKCVYCLDKPKFGGPGTKKQICVKRVCPYPRFAAPATKNSVPGEITSLSAYKKRSRQSMDGDNSQPIKPEPEIKRPKLEVSNPSKEEVRTKPAQPPVRKKLPPPSPPPPPPNDKIDDRPLVFLEDKELVSETIYLTFEQMIPCIMVEADLVGCYKNGEVGYPGLACKHCAGKAGWARYFPPWERSLSQTTTTLTIMNHVMNCVHCPTEISCKLEVMKKEQARMGPEVRRANKPKHGGRKLFFRRLWDRVHEGYEGGMKDEAVPVPKRKEPKGEGLKKDESRSKPVVFKFKLSTLKSEYIEQLVPGHGEESVVFKFNLSTLKAAYMDPASIGIRKHIRNAVSDPYNPKAQDKACELLRKYTTSPANVKKVVLFGGVEMICSAMREHYDKSILQAEACCTLAEMLWVYPGVSLKLSHAGANDLIIAAMNRHTTNIKVQQMGCGAFRALSYDSASIGHITDAASSAVISSMERNPTKPAILKEGCFFLQNMLVYCSTNDKAISESQVVPVIVRGLSDEHFDDEFRQTACGLIANLALNESAKATIGRFGAIHSLIATLNATYDVEVKQAACSALKHLALSSSDNQAKIYQAGGLDAAFSAINTTPDDTVLLVAAFGLMKELCINEEEAARDIVRKGGVKIILKAMKENVDIPTLQVAACGVIGYLLYENRDTSRAQKLASAIIDALKNHGDAAVVQIEGCDALLELATQVPAVRKILKRKDVESLLLRAKSHFPVCESDVDDLLAARDK